MKYKNKNPYCLWKLKRTFTKLSKYFYQNTLPLKCFCVLIEKFFWSGKETKHALLIGTRFGHFPRKWCPLPVLVTAELCSALHPRVTAVCTSGVLCQHQQLQNFNRRYTFLLFVCRNTVELLSLQKEKNTFQNKEVAMKNSIFPLTEVFQTSFQHGESLTTTQVLQLKGHSCFTFPFSPQ